MAQIFPYCLKCSSPLLEGTPAVSAHNISVSYPGGIKNALNHISFTIPSGSQVALLGPNGSGKSTLLKTLVGILPLSSGSIKIFGHPIGTCLHEVTYLPQRSEIDWLFPISLHNLVLTGSYIHLGWFKHPKQEHHQRAIEAMKLLGLESLANRQIGHLSVGQQQRALLARALVHNAALLLLDEPFNAVDTETQMIMRSTFKKLKLEGKTLLIATHDKDHLEQDYDDALFIQNGQLVDATIHINQKNKN